MQRYLYRGVNPEIHKTNDGKLVPKGIGLPFKQGAYYGGSYYCDGSVYGESETNAVVQHQRDSSRNPTSGISTTPSLENARQYATHHGKYQSGYVYQIDTELLDEYGVSKYKVADHAMSPAIPGDEEVILVAKDFDVLPSEIIVDVIEVE
jgi:hypothetical protein